MISRRPFLLAALGGVSLLVSPLRLAAAEAPADPAAAFISRLADAAMQTMVGKGVPDQERAARFRTLFTTDVDLVEIGRRVLGRYWRIATPEQQQEFLRLFEDIVVLTWSTRFKDYGGDLRHTIVGTVDDGDRGLTVSSRVERDRQQPIMLQWRLKRIEGGFRVVDLVVEGSSMAVTYQSEYASVIRAKGDQIDGLLSALRAKVSDLQSGTSAARN
ncbi:MlaC/ttg2D family ABC transporter substrate-binding protein [Magnetospirillum fulvum]|uniref:Phospholipid transport system substrate-binding protein n=1 Tax=Magnetospirillum fulvum TaxID=1082 RepID=A0A1H6GVW9_MAGFU|nr:ABC transporter substrate-binding protein [Magnetospirillum fulvum]SEH27366.1 phospholipid transport system substrate-binding protein [Magnetospirillum fulvum]